MRSLSLAAMLTPTTSWSLPARHSLCQRCAIGGWRTSPAVFKNIMNVTGRGGLRVRGRELPWGARTYVMGIVNLSPDSFSGDGTNDTGAAVARAFAQRDAGADILDLGAESRMSAPAS